MTDIFFHYPRYAEIGTNAQINLEPTQKNYEKLQKITDDYILEVGDGYNFNHYIEYLITKGYKINFDVTKNRKWEDFTPIVGGLGITIIINNIRKCSC